MLTEENAPAVAGICKTLDGLPLALELAAARVTVLPPAALLDRLDDRFRLLTGGPRDAPVRHQALRTAIDWSYDLLAPGEQALFARLSVFAGTCTVEAAADVLGEDAVEVLSSLIDKSLVRLEGTDQAPRFRMLRTIREYALERLLETGEEHIVRDGHLAHYLRLAERAYAERLQSREEARAELRLELDNLRAAADWAAETDPGRELELLGALAWFWILDTTITEAQERLSAALARRGGPSLARARAYYFSGNAAASRGNVAESLPFIEAALAAYRELGDERDVSLALEGLGLTYIHDGDEELAERYLRESLDLRERIGDQFLVRRSLGGICQALVSRGDVDRAESIAADLYRQGSEATDLWAEQSALHYLSDCALIRGDFGIAEQRYARTAAYAWEHGNRTQCANEMHGVAMAASANGDYARALRIAAAASAEWERIWEQRGAVLALPFWTRLQEEHFGRARTALGPEASAAADAEGRALPFELVVKDAVKASTVADTT